MTANNAAGVVLTGLVAYEAAAKLAGKPTITMLSRRYPAVAYMLAGAWLAHVFWKVRAAIEEMEDCEEWH